MLLLLVVSAAMGLSCVESLDIPPAPAFDEVVAAYAAPDAQISSAIMAAVGDELLELRELLRDSEVFDEILDIIVEVQVELDQSTDENGNLVIDGLGSFPNPNAVIELDHVCSGWNPDVADADPEVDGSIGLTMVLDLGDISPVVWGEATQCKFLASLGERSLQSSYDGDIAVHFGKDGEEPIATGEPLRDLVITFVLEGALGVGDKQLPIRRSFRLRGEGVLEILWELEDGTNFVYVFGLDDLQGIRDANCTGCTGAGDNDCCCNLENRQCTLLSGSISW